jgi:hypothetical protein
VGKEIAQLDLWTHHELTEVEREQKETVGTEHTCVMDMGQHPHNAEQEPPDPPVGQSGAVM